MKGPPFAPPKLASIIVEALEDRVHPAYGQAATVGSRGRPQARTVHWRWLPERGTLGFNAHVRSPKWRQLRRVPELSGVYHDATRLIQLRWEASVELVDFKAKASGDRAMLDRAWALMRPEVRLAYWRDWAAAKTRDVAPRCPNLGLAVCRPRVWDVFVLHPKDYNKGRRTIYELKSGVWRSSKVSLLHSRPV
ncbi:MAG: pyridoxamine 5'-phosphate oxidase family protein [Elusimicrobia bacterium]|nr:pyridoxamine 5'-phosphate oxidase family protein [Elusimicrobiota bacterium]